MTPGRFAEFTGEKKKKRREDACSPLQAGHATGALEARPLLDLDAADRLPPGLCTPTGKNRKAAANTACATRRRTAGALVAGFLSLLVLSLLWSCLRPLRPARQERSKPEMTGRVTEQLRRLFSHVDAHPNDRMLLRPHRFEREGAGSVDNATVAVSAHDAAVSDAASGFTEVYRSRKWAHGSNEGGCLSGYSSPRRVRPVLEALASVLDDYDVDSVADVPCGDMCFMAPLLSEAVFPARPGFRYYGADIVGSVVRDHRRQFASPTREGARRGSMRFAVLDAKVEAPPAADLIFSRALTQHLCDQDTLSVLRNFDRSGAKLLLMRTFPGAGNSDLPLGCGPDSERSGDWRPQDLTAPPFGLPPPLRLYAEREEGIPGIALGLWELPLRMPDGTRWEPTPGPSAFRPSAFRPSAFRPSVFPPLAFRRAPPA
jgi:hypothetical protein